MCEIRMCATVCTCACELLDGGGGFTVSDSVYSRRSSSSLNEPNWVRDLPRPRHGKRDRAAYVNATRRQVRKYGIKFP